MSKPYRESAELAGAVRRMVRALVRRASEGDTMALEELFALERETGESTNEAIRVLHSFGYSYGELAGELGVTRQAVRQRVA